MCHMDSELAALSRSIDPAVLGQRIKNARVAAGMTQAQVAGDDVTTAYISRIEDGQRRPEAQLLERMAGRMKSSLEELLFGVTRDEALEFQVALDQAELELVSGNPGAALAGADALAVSAGAKCTPEFHRSLRELRAFALEALGDLDGAIVVLEELTTEPTADARWLKLLIALSRCYRDAGDFSRAISVGEQVSETIDRLEIAGLTEAIQLSITVAAAYLLRGEPGHAMRICKKAIADAEKYDSPVARASAYWNASVIESRAGSLDNALELGRKAIAIFEASDDARNLARLRGEYASILLKADPPDPTGALEALDRAETEAAWSATSTNDASRTLLTRGRAHFLLGDTDRALELVSESARVAPKDAPLARAAALAAQGQIAVASGDRDRGQECYREAILTLSGVGADREAAQLWFELGSLLTEVGETEAAMDAFRRAAASTGLRAAPSVQSTARSDRI